LYRRRGRRGVVVRRGWGCRVGRFLRDCRSRLAVELRLLVRKLLRCRLRSAVVILRWRSVPYIVRSVVLRMGRRRRRSIRRVWKTLDVLSRDNQSEISETVDK